MNIKRLLQAFALILFMFAGAGCNKVLRVTEAPGNNNSFFPAYVAGKLTKKLDEIIPDTLTKKRFEKSEYFKEHSIHLGNRYRFAKIRFNRFHGNKIGFQATYNLDSLFAFVKSEVKITDSNNGEGISEMLDVSLVLLYTYYKEKRKLTSQGKLRKLIPNTDAANRLIFISKLHRMG